MPTYTPDGRQYHELSRREYFRLRATRVYVGSGDEVWPMYMCDGYPRVPLEWQGAWDFIGYDATFGHWRMVRDAIVLHGTKVLTVDNITEYHYMIGKFLRDNPQHNVYDKHKRR